MVAKLITSLKFDKFLRSKIRMTEKYHLGVAKGVPFDTTDEVLSASIADLHGSEALRLGRGKDKIPMNAVIIKLIDEKDLDNIVSTGWVIKEEH